MSNVQLTGVHRNDYSRGGKELVFEQKGNTADSQTYATKDQEYTVPGPRDQEEHQYSVIGTEMTRQNSRKEAQNYLYQEFKATETARHPSVAPQTSTRSVESVLSVESISKTTTCACTLGQFCMYIFIVFVLLLSVAAVAIGILALLSSDDCSCDGMRVYLCYLISKELLVIIMILLPFRVILPSDLFRYFQLWVLIYKP